MIAKELIKRIRNTKGPIFVEVTNFDDGFWIQAKKVDLLSMLSRFEADTETGFAIDEKGYFGKDYMYR